jgi:2-amino-4-hydroxy-6-hydroxymethyldihydropteridine diphosphokinase
MHQVLLLLGTNLGNQELNLQSAIANISNKIGFILKKSSVYITEPWGFVHDNNFYNQVLLLETNLDPEPLLKEILRIEKEMGRDRDNNGYAARIIDIDILFYDDLVMNQENLKIPHPLLHQRKFTLIPLAEIVPEKIHPVLMLNCRELLNNCSDPSLVKLHSIGK